VGRVFYPASNENVIAVGSNSQDGLRSSFSNYGDFLDIVAPGERIPSTCSPDDVCTVSGTSFSTPEVAAVAGIIRSYNPTITADQVTWVLTSTASNRGVRNNDTGFGRMRLDSIVPQIYPWLNENVFAISEKIS
jgi:thermitase